MTTMEASVVWVKLITTLDAAVKNRALEEGCLG